jgi:endonuclease/exonuclease/phosphatase family metal-dependent hydrolase
LLSVFAAVLTQGRPAPASIRSVLRVMTFNLQQGYNASGTRNFAGQLEQIRQIGPDLLGLQESDTARVAGGHSDVVRYLADRLNFHSYYGPRTVTGTFGIALLSRYPIAAARTFYLPSTGEQTGAIVAQISVGEKSYHVVVTHLGNGGPIIQQRDVLKLVAGKPNAILLGDFNLTPADEAYRLTVAGLEDAWLAARERNVGSERLDLDDRIDHVFVSPGTRVLRAEYRRAGASDHPVLCAEIGN